MGPCLLRNKEKDHDDHFKTRLIAAIAAAGIASPALAQSFDPEAGSGNVVPFSYATRLPHRATPSPFGRTAEARLPHVRTALHAFAMVPRGAADGNANDPALTGGGSAGYNEMLQRF